MLRISDGLTKLVQLVLVAVDVFMIHQLIIGHHDIGIYTGLRYQVFSNAKTFLQSSPWVISAWMMSIGFRKRVEKEISCESWKYLSTSSRHATWLTPPRTHSIYNLCTSILYVDSVEKMDERVSSQVHPTEAIITFFGYSVLHSIYSSSKLIISHHKLGESRII